MNKKDIKTIIKVAEKLEWSTKIEEDNYILFSKSSPAGQDFNIEIFTDNLDLEEIINQIEKKYNNFDCSEETYLWLDNTGHGKNGAPYDMKELYEDMEECLKMMNELLEELQIL